MSYTIKLFNRVINWMNLFNPSGHYEEYTEEIKAGYITINEALHGIEKILTYWQHTEQQRGNTEKVTEIKRWKNALIFLYE